MNIRKDLNPWHAWGHSESGSGASILGKALSSGLLAARLLSSLTSLHASSRSSGYAEGSCLTSFVWYHPCTENAFVPSACSSVAHLRTPAHRPESSSQAALGRFPGNAPGEQDLFSSCDFVTLYKSIILQGHPCLCPVFGWWALLNVVLRQCIHWRIWACLPKR